MDRHTRRIVGCFLGPRDTLRARLAHLVRRSLSFSRRQSHLEAVVWLFIHHYNASFP
jgi:hypothetical protein